MSNLRKAGNFLHRMTPPGEPLIKCPTCPKGNQWHGSFAFELISGKKARVCKKCREHKKG